jgi:hypothetical protein
VAPAQTGSPASSTAAPKIRTRYHEDTASRPPPAKHTYVGDAPGGGFGGQLAGAFGAGVGVGAVGKAGEAGGELCGGVRDVAGFGHGGGFPSP